MFKRAYLVVGIQLGSEDKFVLVGAFFRGQCFECELSKVLNGYPWDAPGPGRREDFVLLLDTLVKVAPKILCTPVRMILARYF